MRLNIIYSFIISGLLIAQINLTLLNTEQKALTIKSSSNPTIVQPKKYEYFIQLMSYIGDEIENSHIVEDDGKGPYSFCFIKFVARSEEFSKQAHVNKHLDNGLFEQHSTTIFVKKLTNSGLCEVWTVKLPTNETTLIGKTDEQETINFDSDKYYSIVIDELNTTIFFEQLD